MSESALPPLYERWITEIAGVAPAGEPAATCDDCAMVTDAPGMSGYDPGTKCCTYIPALPNFLVGAALADESLDALGGRESVRARIRARAGVAPLGLAPGPAALLLLREAPEAFGKSKRLICPHYHADTGLCGVWRHRDAVCSTWFCKHERGQTGLSYWLALRGVLMRIERELSHWCVLELDAPYRPPSLLQPPPPPDSLTASDLEGSADDAAYERRWGAWAGREAELYARCHELVRDLAWADVEGIAGPELRLLVRELGRAGDKRDRTFVPASLLVRRLEILRGGNPLIVASYSGTDPLAMPPALASALPTFRGQPVEEARAELAESGLAIGDDLIVRLVDFGVLGEPD